MVKKKHKGYWVKRSERFSTGAEAKGRAAGLRQHRHICHVQVAKKNNRYEVLYSVAKFYMEDLRNAGIEL